MAGKSSIVINGRFWSQRPTGVQKFASGMVRHLQEADPEILVLVPPGTRPPEGVRYRTTGFLRGAAWEQLCLAWFMLTHRDLVLVHLCNTAPLLVRRQYITLHDLAFEQDQPWFSGSFRRWYRFLIPRIVRRSLGVFTISPFTAREITEHYHCPPDKMSLVTNGAPVVNVTGEPLIKGKYLLLPDVFNPRKNAPLVLGILPFLHSLGFSLVTTGAEKSIYHQHISLPPGVIHLGFVTEVQYQNLLHHASAFVYPSHYEGFGLAVLESLVSGTCPVVSDLNVFHESFGDLSLYFHDEPTLKEALSMLGNWTISEEQQQDLTKKYNFARSSRCILNRVKDDTQPNENSPGP